MIRKKNKPKVIVKDQMFLKKKKKVHLRTFLYSIPFSLILLYFNISLTLILALYLFGIYVMKYFIGPFYQREIHIYIDYFIFKQSYLTIKVPFEDVGFINQDIIESSIKPYYKEIFFMDENLEVLLSFSAEHFSYSSLVALCSQIEDYNQNTLIN
jgi:hypothetical protein